MVRIMALLTHLLLNLMASSDEKELEFELLRVQYYEMEAEHNSLKAERDSAQDECTHLAAQCQQLRDALRETQVLPTGDGAKGVGECISKYQSKTIMRELQAVSLFLHFPLMADD
jgi:hypothetical protein